MICFNSLFSIKGYTQKQQQLNTPTQMRKYVFFSCKRGRNECKMIRLAII